MRLPKNVLKLMIREDAFRVSRLMTASSFVNFCKQRGLNVDKDRLRQFERIGVFRPLLRAYLPEITLKIETVENGYRELGELQSGEDWRGETRSEVVHFTPETRYAREWDAEGLLWVPGQGGGWPHEATIDFQPDRHEAYYSPFMVWPLQRLVLSAFTLSVQLEWGVRPDGTADSDWGSSLSENGIHCAVSGARGLRGDTPDYVTAVFCQLIANRFWYKTQTDGRRITVGQFHDWNWRDYARQWSPSASLKAFDLSEEDSRNRYELLDICWHHLDPLAAWYSLARFVKVDKRQRLKGDALCALTIREMAHMWRLFHEEAFGAALAPLGEVAVHVIKPIPDVDPEVDPLRAVEFTANDFGVNGKPQLVFFIEGQTEQAVIPSIFERLWAAPPARYGIEFFNLHGVGNATGGKKARYSALWLLADYLHHHQTVAFVLLDNEGLAARNVKSGLASAPSVSSELRRATRANYVKLWKHSFEFDNFSNSELALALNLVAGEQLFRPSDLESIRNPPAGRSRPQPSLERLFKDRTGHGLNKVTLGRQLEVMMFDPQCRRAVTNRPISKLLLKVGKTAALNHQPNTTEIWEANQRSGHVGALLPKGQHQRRRERAARKAPRGARRRPA